MTTHVSATAKTLILAFENIADRPRDRLSHRGNEVGEKGVWGDVGDVSRNGLRGGDRDSMLFAQAVAWMEKVADRGDGQLYFDLHACAMSS